MFMDIRLHPSPALENSQPLILRGLPHPCSVCPPFGTITGHVPVFSLWLSPQAPGAAAHTCVQLMMSLLGLPIALSTSVGDFITGTVSSAFRVPFLQLTAAHCSQNLTLLRHLNTLFYKLLRAAPGSFCPLVNISNQQDHDVPVPVPHPPSGTCQCFSRAEPVLESLGVRRFSLGVQGPTCGHSCYSWRSGHSHASASFPSPPHPAPLAESSGRS